MTELAPIIALVAREPPRSLTGFAAKLLVDEATTTPVATATFSIGCGACGHDRFDAIERTVHSGQHGPSPVGLDLECAACGERGEIFDARLHGYDGELGHLDCLSGEPGQQPLCDKAGHPLRAVRVKTVYVFNIEMAELEEIARDEGKRVPDLFDWFHLLSAREADWAEVWDWECA